MSNVAIDVVLLPPKPIWNRAVELNKQLFPAQDNPNLIMFSRRVCLPHISLAMICLKRADLNKFKKQLALLAKDFAPLQLTATDIYVEALPGNKYDSGMAVSKTAPLMALQQKIIALTRQTAHPTATAADLYPPPPITSFTLKWINNYVKNSTAKSFSPHITLGLGKLPNTIKTPMPFVADRLAICHLGNYCTCRKILFETKLKE